MSEEKVSKARERTQRAQASNQHKKALQVSKLPHSRLTKKSKVVLMMVETDPSEGAKEHVVHFPGARTEKQAIDEAITWIRKTYQCDENEEEKKMTNEEFRNHYLHADMGSGESMAAVMIGEAIAAALRSITVVKLDEFLQRAVTIVE